MTTYLLDNAQPQTAHRFTNLERLYDPTTTRTLTRVGVTEGWRCLEVGAGGGSIARWLSDRVGPTGRVLATDLDTRWLDVTGVRWPDNVEVAERDLTRDVPAAGTYDLAHARLVLMHLPERDRVLTGLVDALKPGGWLVVEELDPISPYQPDPETPTDHLINRVGDAFTAALHRHGANNARGRWAHRILAGVGLVDIHNEGMVVVATGGSPAAELMQANATQVAGEMIAESGLSREDISRYVTALDDPAVTFFMPTFFSASGRKPQ